MGRIRYGVKNMHYATITTTAGKETYGTPIAIKGCKSISLDANGDSLDEYADDTTWDHEDANAGYTGTLEMEDTAAVDEFLETVLGMTKDANGVVIENTGDVHKEFALLGQFSLSGGDGETGKRFLFYRVTVGRPSVSGTTNESGKTVATNSLSLTAMGRMSDDNVKATCISTDSAYGNWFSKVYESPTE